MSFQATPINAPIEKDHKHVSVTAFTCSFCPKSFGKRSNLTRHIKNTHLLNTKISFKCENCKKSFTTKSNLKKHLKVHAETPTHDICQHSGESFPTSQHLTQHMKNKHSYFKCEICPKQFTTKANLNKHTKIHSDTPARQETPAHQDTQSLCQHCGAIFSNNADLKRHEQTHFSSQHLTPHIENTHSSFQCEICSKTYTAKVNLNNHMKIHSETATHRDSLCQYCGANFSNNKNLIRHERTHFRMRCITCHKVFRSTTDLHKHTLEKHDIERIPLFPCQHCKQVFHRRDFLERHNRIHKARTSNTLKITYTCKICEQEFTEISDLIEHNREKHSSAVNLENDDLVSPPKSPSSSSPSSSSSSSTKREHSPNPSTSKRHKSTENRSKSKLRENVLRPHPNDIIKTNLPLSDFLRNSEMTAEEVLEHFDLDMPTPNSPNNMADIILDNHQAIKTHSIEPSSESFSKRKSGIGTRYCSEYNVIFQGQADRDINQKLIIQEIFNRQKKRFKINFSYNFLLHENETGMYRFYHASRDTGKVLDIPQRIDNQKDLDLLIEKVENHQPWEWASIHRPNTVWSVKAILSTTYFVTPLLDRGIGLASEEVPTFLKNRNSLIQHVKNPDTHQNYDDTNCFFRCLASHKTGKAYIEQEAKYYRSLIEGPVELGTIPIFEDFFSINVNIFSPDLQAETVYAEVRSGSTHVDSMNLLLYKNHFMYIKDIDQLQLSFSCQKCNAIFDKPSDLTRHEKTCNGETTKVYFKGGVYRQGKSNIDILHAWGVDIPENYIHPYRITFDFESYLKPIDRKTLKTQYLSQHIVLSVSLCSNVPGFEEPECIISDGDTQGLVDKMGDHMDKIRAAAIALMNREPEIIGAYASVRGDGDGKDANVKGGELLDKFLNQIPVVGFNSGKYDLNVCKAEIINRFVGEEMKYIQHRNLLIRAKEAHKKKLEEEQRAEAGEVEVEDVYLEGEEEIWGDKWIPPIETGAKAVAEAKAEANAKAEAEANAEAEEDEFAGVDINEEVGPPIDDPLVVKKANNFLVIKTTKYIFLDIINFLAPGFNYSSYLKAFGATETKGYLPYEYFTDLEKLEETECPTQEAFFSKLRNRGISDADYAIFLNIWAKEGFKTLRELLVWYNNLDTKPFLQALENQTRVFAEALHMDMLKDGWTMPGLTLKYLFKSLKEDPANKWVFFSLPEPTQGHFHKLLRDQMVGGPSIVFTRYHEKGVTKIKGEEGKSVEICAGFDANALYLWAMMQKHPSEFPITRTKDKNFSKSVIRKYGQTAREWLEWLMAENEDLHIQHQFNGKEKRFGSYLLDGWDAVSRTAYEFNGCAFHGHLIEGKPCKLSQPTHPYDKSLTRAMLYEAFLKKSRYLKEYRPKLNLQVIWECEWERLKKSNGGKIEIGLDKSGIRFHSAFEHEDKTKTIINEKLILQKIKSEQFFGLICCDIKTPENLKSVFEEFPPIFKNVNISKEDVGDHMKTYCEEKGFLKQPRKSLISSYFGDQIVLSSPLLKWYLEHNLVVTNITELYEYKPSSCFKSFGEMVTKNRREGDAGGDKIKADTFKLAGNCSYGKTCQNNKAHVDNIYLTCEEDSNNQLVLLRQVEIAKNKRNFVGINELGENLYEVTAAKSKIVWDLPHQIGFFVYQYAKLKMLAFYYDCLIQYIDPSDFELIEMDTDSLYMALSGTSLDDLIIPEKRQTFFEQRHLWFPSESCEEHRLEYIKAKTEKQDWVQKSCCLAQQTFDKRTPGLMKLEWSGDGCVALCSKTYICFDNDDRSNDKLATKGVNKNLNPYTKHDFKGVIENKASMIAENRGFRTNGKFIETYVQNKIGLPYVYVKRKVLDDRIRTKPLDL